MLFSLAACSKQTDYSGQTITGQVTAIDGTKITLQLGELTEQNAGIQDSQPGAVGQPGENGDGQTPPDLPAGEQQNAGQMPGGETPPEKPDGDNSMPGGEMQIPEGNNPMGGFTAGEETVILDFDGATIQVEAGMETTEGTLDFGFQNYDYC